MGTTPSISSAIGGVAPFGVAAGSPFDEKRKGGRAGAAHRTSQLVAIDGATGGTGWVRGQ